MAGVKTWTGYTGTFEERCAQMRANATRPPRVSQVTTELPWIAYGLPARRERRYDELARIVARLRQVPSTLHPDVWARFRPSW